MKLYWYWYWCRCEYVVAMDESKRDSNFLWFWGSYQHSKHYNAGLVRSVFVKYYIFTISLIKLKLLLYSCTQTQIYTATNSQHSQKNGFPLISIRLTFLFAQQQESTDSRPAYYIYIGSRKLDCKQTVLVFCKPPSGSMASRIQNFPLKLIKGNHNAHTHTSSLQHELPLQSLAQTTSSDVICLKKEQKKKLLLCVETYICHSAQTSFTNPKSWLCPFTSQTLAHFCWDVCVVCSDMHIYYICHTYVCVCAPQTSNPKSKQTTLT